jgi:hypothetical protein
VTNPDEMICSDGFIEALAVILSMDFPIEHKDRIARELFHYAATESRFWAEERCIGKESELSEKNFFDSYQPKSYETYLREQSEQHKTE